MLEKGKLISVCIPAYNRAALLPALLDSILAQGGDFYEVVICEDHSPERPQIRAIAERYMAQYPDRLVYHENVDNLGYDGNLRHMVDVAKGEYVLFMGNDDLMAEGALSAVANAVQKHPHVGVVLRSYNSFQLDIRQPLQTFRYFDEERFFQAGAATIVTFFRRCVFISGMVVRRQSAKNCATDRFDGTLLYQQHLVGQILAKENGVYLPQILSHHRLGGTPDFGNSAAEQGKFTPKEQTPESSIHFMRGMLYIARDLERTLGWPVFRPILKDIGNYAYPIISIQAGGSRWALMRYVARLSQLGFWRVPLFYIYATGLFVLGRRRCDALIGMIKAKLGRAPVLGSVYTGQK